MPNSTTNVIWIAEQITISYNGITLPLMHKSEHFRYTTIFKKLWKYQEDRFQIDSTKLLVKLTADESLKS